MGKNIIDVTLISRHDIEAKWQESAYIPQKGEIIVYDIEGEDDSFPEGRHEPYSYERFKIGDGKTEAKLLPFTDEHLLTMINNINLTLSIDYDASLAFNTDEVIFGSDTTSILGQAILGQMILA